MHTEVKNLRENLLSFARAAKLTNTDPDFLVDWLIGNLTAANTFSELNDAICPLPDENPVTQELHNIFKAAEEEAARQKLKEFLEKQRTAEPAPSTVVDSDDGRSEYLNSSSSAHSRASSSSYSLTFFNAGDEIAEDRIYTGNDTPPEAFQINDKAL